MADYDTPDPSRWTAADTPTATTAPTAVPTPDPARWTPGAPKAPTKPAVPDQPSDKIDPTVDATARIIKNLHDRTGGYLMPDPERYLLAGSIAGLHSVGRALGYNSDQIANSKTGQFMQNHPFLTFLGQLASDPFGEGVKLAVQAPGAIAEKAPEIPVPGEQILKTAPRWVQPVWRLLKGAGMYGLANAAGRTAGDVAGTLFPGHPGVREAVQAAGQLAGPMAAERYGPPLLKTAVGGQISDIPARKAAETQTEANLKELQKRQGAAVEEAAAQKAKTEAAATEAGGKAFEQRQKFLADTAKKQQEALATREQEAQAAHDEMTRVQREARVQRDTNVARATAAETERQRGDIARQYIADQLGTPAKSYGAMDAGPQRDQRDLDFRHEATAGEEAYADDWHTRRESAIGPTERNKVLNVEVPEGQKFSDMQPLLDEMARDEQQWQNENYVPHEQVKNIWDDLKRRYSPPPPPPTDEELFMSQGVAAGGRNRAGQAQAGFGAEAAESMAKAARDNPESDAGRLLKSLREDYAKTNPPPAPTTINDLLKEQQRLKAIARRLPNDAGQVAINRVVKGMDDVIEAHVPPDANAARLALNKEWFGHRNNFPLAFDRRINSVAIPLTAAHDIFIDNPQRAMDMWDHAEQFKTPQTQTMMRQMWSEKALDDPRFVANTSQKILDRMFKDDPYLKNKQSWIFAKEDIEGLADMLNHSPTMVESIQRKIQDQLVGFDRVMAKATVDNALKNADAHGVILGNRLKADIKAAEDAREPRLPGETDEQNRLRSARTAPQRAAAVVERFYSQNPPSAAVATEQSEQVPPERQLAQQPINVREPRFAAGAAAGQAQAGANRAARQGLAEVAPGGVGSTIPGQPGVRTGAMPQTPPGVTTPREAEIANLRSGYVRTPFGQRIVNRGQIWVPELIGGGMIGHFSGYSLVGATELLGVGWRETIIRAMRQAMRDDPAMAAKVLQGLREGNPLKEQMRLGRLVRRTARGPGLSAGGVQPPQYLYDPLSQAIARSLYADGMAKMGATKSDREEFERLQGLSSFPAYPAKPGMPAGMSPGETDDTAGAAAMDRFRHGLPSPTTTSTPPGPVSRNTGPGPGIKAAERMRAENIGPSRGTADAAQRLAKDVSKKAPVDVTRRLASGAHSVDEIKQTLAAATNPRAGNALNGMPIQDALTAVEMADPDEKRLLLPILMARLRQELPGIRNATTQNNLSQRFQRLNQMALA